jgi:hypothetical protein
MKITKTAGAGVAFAVLALAAVACGGDDDNDRTPTPGVTRTPGAAGSPTPPGGTPTPVATPTVVATPGGDVTLDGCPLTPVDCELMALFGGAGTEADIDAIMERLATEAVTCDPDVQGSPATPVCEGAAKGEVRRGYAVGYMQSEGAIITEAAMRSELARYLQGDASKSDSHGDGANRVATVGCPIIGGKANCDGVYFAVVFTNIASDGQRRVVEFTFTGTEEGPYAPRTLFGGAAIRQEFFSPEMIAGGEGERVIVFDGSSTGTQYTAVTLE